MLDYNDLQFFAAVVNHRSFSAAARTLGVPKSRLSRRVAVLEEHLGVRLLERSTRHLALTQVGEQVFEHASAAVAQAEAIEDAALSMQAEPRGLVRVSCPIGLHGALADALPAFLESNPKLKLVVIATDRRVDHVHESIDVAVCVRENLDTDGDLQMRRIGHSRRILVSNREFARNHGWILKPADLIQLPLLSQTEHPARSIWNLSSSSGTMETVTFEPRFASGSFDLLMSSARGGLGVALLPAVKCRQDLESGRLVQVLPEWSGIDGILHLVFTSRRGMLPGVRATVEFLAQALRIAVD